MCPETWRKTLLWEVLLYSLFSAWLAWLHYMHHLADLLAAKPFLYICFNCTAVCLDLPFHLLHCPQQHLEIGSCLMAFLSVNLHTSPRTLTAYRHGHLCHSQMFFGFWLLMSCLVTLNHRAFNLECTDGLAVPCPILLSWELFFLFFSLAVLHYVAVFWVIHA